MYHLYCAPRSAAMATLEELQVPFELHFINVQSSRPPEYLRLNPHGKVPTLVVGDDPGDPAHAIY